MSQIPDPNTKTGLTEIQTLRQNLKSLKWTDISNSIPSIFQCTKSQNPEIQLESLQALTTICINHSSNLNFSLIFKEIKPICHPIMEKENKAHCSELFKLLSVLHSPKLNEDYLDFFDQFEKFLELHQDEVLMAYILEMLIGMFKSLNIQQSYRVLKQACEILEKGQENDLIEYCFQYIEKSLEVNNIEFCKKTIEFKGIISLLPHFGNNKYIDRVVNILSKIAVLPESVDDIKNVFGAFIGLLDNDKIEYRRFAARVIETQAGQGWDFLENMINRNFIPILINNLTKDEEVVKRCMIGVVKCFFRQQLQHQIIELVENNVVTVLCRIAERDGVHRDGALEAMELLLDGGNEIFKSFADSCRFSRLLTTLCTDANYYQTCKRILERHYPRVQIPACRAPATNILQTLPQPNINSQIQNNFIPSGATLQLTPNTLPLPIPAITQPLQNPVTSNQLFNPPTNAIQKATPIKKSLKAPKKPKIPKKIQNNTHKKAKTLGPVYKQSQLNLTPTNQGKVPLRVQRLLSKIGIFPIGRLHRKMKSNQYRVSKKAAVFLAGALEYLCAEVLDISSQLVKRHNRKKILPRDLLQSIREDYELDQLLKGTIFAESGNLSFNFLLSDK